MIDRNLVRTNAPSNIGEQVHINHTGCTAGEDTKRRLYIKRVVGGVLAYCQHCSQHQFLRERNDSGVDMHKWLTGKDVEVPEVDLLDKVPLYDPRITRGDGRDWLELYHLNPVDTMHFKQPVGRSDQVALQLFDWKGRFVGVQIRNTVCKPKYITKYKQNTTTDSAWFVRDASTLFITEDYLSAYRIYIDSTTSSLALLKTTASEKTIEQVCSMNYKTIFVWLDHDEAGIKGATKLYNRLKLLSTARVFQVVADREPKEFTPNDLEEFCKHAGY